MVVKSLKAWLLPTVLGPFVTTWGIVAALLLLTGQIAIFDARLDTWAFAFFVTGLIAAGQVVWLLLADWILLRAKIRRLPLGGNAWSSLLAPPVLFTTWMIPVPVQSLAGALLWIAATMAISAFLVRFVVGRRPTATS
jgi:hypothetical protein